MASLVCSVQSLFLNSYCSHQTVSSYNTCNTKSSDLKLRGISFTIHQLPILPCRAQVVGSPRRMAQPPIHEGQTPPVIQEQRVIIQNKYGEKLVGVLHETGSTELVILCHGFLCSKEHRIIKNLAVALGKEGISVFRFDFAGNGESEGSFEFGNYRREAEDLHAVVLHFSGAKRLISAIFGHSKGGDVVLLYASSYPDVHTVVNASGRFNLERGIEIYLGKDFMQRIKKDGFIDVKNNTGKFKYRVTEESLMDRLNIDMHAACLSIQKDCRVLTIHGSKDEVIPVEDALELAKVVPNHKLHIVEGADHGYSAHQAELTSTVLEFIKAGIQQKKDMPT